MNMITKANNQLEPIVLLTKYAHDAVNDYELSETKTPWLKELLDELHETLDPEDKYPAGSFLLNLQITRKKNQLLGDHLIVRADLNIHYHLPCIITLAPVPQHMLHHVDAVFLHESQENFPEHAEATTTYAEGQEMELYFYRKGEADIKEFIHEQIFLEVPHFPKAVEKSLAD